LTKQGVPVRFRTYETGTPIDFVLIRDDLLALTAEAK
jgi:hypothetical protein